MRIKRLFTGSGGFNQSFIIRFFIILVLLIVIIAEFIPLLWYRWTTYQDAEDLVDTLVAEYRLYHNPQQTMVTATEKLKLMGYSDDEIRQCVVAFLPEGAQTKTSLRITCVKYANTLVTRHIKQLEKYSRVASTKERDL